MRCRASVSDTLGFGNIYETNRKARSCSYSPVGLTLFPNWLTSLILPRLYGEELYTQLNLALVSLSGLRNLLVLLLVLACTAFLMHSTSLPPGLCPAV